MIILGSRRKRKFRLRDEGFDQREVSRSVVLSIVCLVLLQFVGQSCLAQQANSTQRSEAANSTADRYDLQAASATQGARHVAADLPLTTLDRMDEQGEQRQQATEESPTLAELTAAATAAGMAVGDLVNQAAEAEAASHADGDGELVAGYQDGIRNVISLPVPSAEHMGASRPAIYASSRNLEQVDPAARGQSSPQDEDVSYQIERDMPDSIESLMGSEREDLDEQPSTGEADRRAALMANSQRPSPGDGLAGADDDEDEDDDTERQAQLQPLDYQSLANGNGQLMGQLGISPVDLNTAAGHHYGKKKKVKKVIIKKKKKKKKYKKIKKVKIIKIKKKKKKKKKYVKKKPKKHHHHHHHDHGKYYMYAKVPKKKSWEFGFKKGNKKHWIERHEKGHKNKFKTKVKWYDKKSKGKGVHIWDYNHHDKKKKKHY